MNALFHMPLICVVCVLQKCMSVCYPIMRMVYILVKMMMIMEGPPPLTDQKSVSFLIYCKHLTSDTHRKRNEDAEACKPSSVILNGQLQN